VKTYTGRRIQRRTQHPDIEVTLHRRHRWFRKSHPIKAFPLDFGISGIGIETSVPLLPTEHLLIDIAAENHHLCRLPCQVVYSHPLSPDRHHCGLKFILTLENVKGINREALHLLGSIEKGLECCV